MEEKIIKMHAIRHLSAAQKAALEGNNISDVHDFIAASPVELSRKLKVSASEVQTMIENVSEELPVKLTRLARLHQKHDRLTTGDPFIDRILGGGIRTGMVWEICGESASGKTQLALQLSLLVQLPSNLGGLSGSACYFTSQNSIPTNRLTQLTAGHPLLSSSLCTLSDIYTMSVPTFDVLMYALHHSLPALQESLSNMNTRKPVRLVTIDSVTAYFRTSENVSASNLHERAKVLSELSRMVHNIAQEDNIVFIIINEVAASFEKIGSPYTSPSPLDELDYREQVQWFGSAPLLSGQGAKEAALGLAWTNQLNARIMLTRTTSLFSVTSLQTSSDELHLYGMNAKDESHSGIKYEAPLLRCLSVIFSPLSDPKSLYYIVTNEGIAAVNPVASTK